MRLEAFPILTVRNLEASRHFYERLGFVASHEGMKLALSPGSGSAP